MSRRPRRYWKCPYCGAVRAGVTPINTHLSECPIRMGKPR